MLRECRITDDVSAETLNQIPLLDRLASQHESTGAFALAATKKRELAQCHRLAGDTVAADSADRAADALDQRAGRKTMETSTATDASQLTGYALYAFNLTHPKKARTTA